MEENKNKKTGWLVFLMILFLVIAIGLGGFLIYDKLIKEKKETECTCPKCDTCEKCEKTDCTSSILVETLKNRDGKIVVKRNGVATLETVPSDIVGKYQHEIGDYYKLNSDGTAEIGYNPGGGPFDVIKSDELTYQLTIIPGGATDGSLDTVIVDFALNSKTHMYVPGDYLVGNRVSGEYSFMIATETPTAHAYDQESKFEKK